MPRDAAGIYTLPNPPVVPNTTIMAPDENTTRDDMAAELTNSLDRNGRGGMLAPFKIADGLVGTPGLAFLNEPNSGLWRSGAGVVNMAVQGINIMAWQSDRVTLNRQLRAVDGNAATPGISFVGDPTIGFFRGAPALSVAFGGIAVGGWNSFGWSAGATFATATSRNRVSSTLVDTGATTQNFHSDFDVSLTGGSSVINRGIFSGALYNNNTFNGSASLANGGSLQGIVTDISVTGGVGGTVTAATGVRATVRNTGAGTVANLVGFQPTFVNSGGGTVTNAYGLHVQDITVGTNAFGVHLGVAAGANRWNLFATGTADNYIAGNLYIGNNVGTAANKVRVNATVVDGGTFNNVNSTLDASITANSASIYRGLVAIVTANQGAFDLTSALAGGGGVTGLFADAAATGASGTVTAVVGTRSVARNTGAGIVTTLAGFQASFANSGGGTVGNAHGFHMPPNSIGTFRTAFFGEIAASGNAAWNLYMAGTAPNFLNGVLNIRNAAPPAAAGASLVVADGLTTAIFGADSNLTTITDATIKNARIGIPHFTNAEEPLGLIFAQTSAGASSITIGGGTSVFNAATQINFATADNNITPTGTTRMSIISSGQVGMGVAGSPSAQLALPASTAALAPIRLTHGVAPTAPVNGDMWTTTAGLFVRINGVTVGPLT